MIDINLDNKYQTELLHIELRAKTDKIKELESKYVNDKKSKDNLSEKLIEGYQNKVLNELINKSNNLFNLKKYDESIIIILIIILICQEINKFN